MSIQVSWLIHRIYKKFRLYDFLKFSDNAISSGTPGSGLGGLNFLSSSPGHTKDFKNAYYFSACVGHNELE